MLLIALLCGTLIEYLNGCQEKGSVWVALQTCDARAGFFFPSSDNR